MCLYTRIGSAVYDVYTPTIGSVALSCFHIRIGSAMCLYTRIGSAMYDSCTPALEARCACTPALEAQCILFIHPRSGVLPMAIYAPAILG